MKSKSMTPRLSRKPLRFKKPLFSLLSVLFSAALFPAAAFASGGNAITNSTIFTGIQNLLRDASVALLIIAPVLGGLLVGLFSLLASLQSEPQDKEKWYKNRKTTLVTVGIVLGASSIIAIISNYFGG